jgi:hypothetical protein
MKRLFRPVLVSWACSLVFVTPSHSQTEDHFAMESAEGTVPITVVLAQGHGPPLIFRRATEPKNVIVVNRSTNAAQLSSAVFSLLVAEAGDPSGGERSDNAALRVTMPHSTPAYQEAGEVVSRLQNARTRRVGTFGGELRAVDIWVGPRRGRHQ